ncbi:thiamine pyrophosphate-dependent dehydrogenase E1 component subunit alpha [Jiangella asiatica]|uniref:Thiamine pyrophosphate-dependent dehydrogenase E1 component subunit alpha n=1 Tax=Jiangella asiatica TaxID=2530372 RepID=A0A4R5D8H3_9ACTN|nr:thiamine pyrophosphate-dependent dehydrogenase E1 component subunit alpha [Jiangella asiatica]TDE09859.1 thiamine pyrophosphate-dependent dehydrogenase E1 component subunit alpha [Jiangella asiatica]
MSTSLDRRVALRDPTARLERMMEIREFEGRVKDLFFEGVVSGTTHLCEGQEAVSVGLAATLRPTDHVTCTYRGHGVALALGCEPSAVLGEIMGRTVGLVGGVGGSMHLSERAVGLMPTFAIVGGGIPVAVGAGLSCQVLGGDDVAVAVFGDGATNIGAFHESLNLAAVWKLPVVFVVENNLYGEYSPIASTTAVTDLAVRAGSYAMPAETVDGQVVDDVAAAVRRAVERARGGDGPTLLEMKTYRYSGHSRADTGPYRPDGELEAWQGRDPIALYADALVAAGTVTAGEVDALRSAVTERIDEVVAEVRQAPEPDPSAMFGHIHA